MANQYLTVVFEHDGSSELPQKITKAFADETAFDGCTVTAISNRDEITRMEELEEEFGV